jgi:transposase-like protein
MRFVAHTRRKAVAAALKPIYTAADEKAARAELDAFAASELGRANPNTVRVFEDAWTRFVPFLAFPPAARRVLHTTNSIESLNHRPPRVSSRTGDTHRNDESVVKLLWLAICDIEDKRAREREKERDKPTKERKTWPRLVEGRVTTNWKQALVQLALAYPYRIQPHLN